ncbi:hypothetical protein X747_28840 [Mesorhizobium sp. LNJC384A00]|uniref:hypothetical protein n=1 Tax=Mesorhizobium sp. LNJC384A00 TaxID=1287268 RepID=UPI0003CDD17D|nr:hypothetical protein [Mesorhizobium sp. LNJC384A00]ESY35308.1 hypothetical protein X747_28840 [Mesorhizobium sp. LNJC384A00]
MDRFRRNILGLAVLGGLAAAGVVNATAAGNPLFKDYLVDVYQGRGVSDIDKSDDTAKRYRTRFRAALKEHVNFAGHYVFASWGAGTGCDEAGIVDVRTGRAILFPVAACRWEEMDTLPFRTKADSRLVVLAGQIGEDGAVGAHYFLFDGQAFTPVGAKSFNIDKLIAELPAAGPVLDGVPTVRPQSNLPGISSVVPSGSETPTVTTIAVTADIQQEFTKVLILAVLRTDFPSPNLNNFDAKAAETVSALAKVLLQTSVRQPLTANGVHYDLLYNSMADLFILIRYEGTRWRNWGLCRGPPLLIAFTHGHPTRTCSEPCW